MESETNHADPLDPQSGPTAADTADGLSAAADHQVTEAEPDVIEGPGIAESEVDAGEGAGIVESEAETAEAPVEKAETAEDEPVEGEPDEEEGEPLPELTPEDEAALGRVLFSLLFVSPDALSIGRLKDLTESPAQHVRVGLSALEDQLAQSGLPLVLRQIAGGFRLFSSPEVAEIVARLSKVKRAEKVSPAMLETLSIVAYRQPTTNAEVEAIRGVQAGPMLRNLIDRGLVKVTGRADQPGSPLLYGTTREFLDRFGLASLKDLPRDNELAR